MARKEDDLRPEESGTLLRFFLEKHDQAQFARKTDGGAQIPGIDAIETVVNGEKLPEQGIIVHAEVIKGYEGVVSVYQYDKIDAVDIDDSRPKFDQVRMGVHFHGVKELNLSYENPNYAYKHVEPFNRMQATNYIGFSFEDLDIFDLSDRGRFLLAKHTLNIGGLYTSFDRRFEDIKDEEKKREVTVVFDKDNQEGALEAIKTIMSKLIGVQDQDVELIALQTKEKLNK